MVEAKLLAACDALPPRAGVGDDSALRDGRRISMVGEFFVTVLVISKLLKSGVLLGSLISCAAAIEENQENH